MRQGRTRGAALRGGRTPEGLSGCGGRFAVESLFAAVVGLERLFEQEEGARQVSLVEHIGDAHLVAAVGRVGVEARGGGHHDGLALVAEVAQAPGAEVVAVLDRQAGHRVEGSHGDGRVDARNAVESVDEALAALDVLLVNLGAVGARGVDGGLGDNLSQQRGRETRLAELHHRVAQPAVLGDEGADADAALGVALRDGVNQHDMLLDALQMAGRDVGRTRVDEFAVDLVREEEEVVAFDQIADAVHLLARVEVSGGVVGVANQDAARAFVDKPLEFGDVGQREALLDGRDDGADDRTGRDGEGHVVGIGRLGDDNLVARIEARHEGEEHGLGAARGDDDFVGRELDLVLGVVFDQLLAQRAVTVAGAVFEHCAVDVAQCVEADLRRGQVGLSDVEVVDFCAARLGRFGQRHELAYGRSRHQLRTLGNGWHRSSLILRPRDCAGGRLLRGVGADG